MRESGEKADVILVQLVGRPRRNRGDDAADPSPVELDRGDDECRSVVEFRGAMDRCRASIVEHERLVPLGERSEPLGRDAEREDPLSPGRVEAPDRTRNELLRRNVLNPKRCPGRAQDRR